MSRSNAGRLACVFLLAASASVPLGAEPAPAATAAPVAADAPLEPGEGRAVALKLSDDLVSSFVFRQQAEDYAAMLRRNAAAGRYDNASHAQLA